MQIGYIGLGKMGNGMVTRLLARKHNVITFDQNEEAVRAAENQGAVAAKSLEDLASKLNAPRTIWIMVPHHAVDAVLGNLTPYLADGDTIIDGGNSFFEDSKRRAAELSGESLRFLDVGVSGGPEGAIQGACMMIGGDRGVYEQYIPLFADLCVDRGYGYMGESGAGHFVKMAHNGIEYGMMQAIAEGFHIMKGSSFDLDLEKVASVYGHGSVIESRFMEWLKEGFSYWGEDLKDVSGSVEHSGEGQWTVETARTMNIPTPIIEGALKFRIDSEKEPSYAGKIVSMLRNQFGGHAVKKK